MFKVLLFRVLSKVLLFWSKVLLFLRMSEHLCLLLSLLSNLAPGDTFVFLTTSFLFCSSWWLNKDNVFELWLSFKSFPPLLLIFLPNYMSWQNQRYSFLLLGFTLVRRSWTLLEVYVVSLPPRKSLPILRKPLNLRLSFPRFLSWLLCDGWCVNSHPFLSVRAFFFHCFFPAFRLTFGFTVGLVRSALTFLQLYLYFKVLVDTTFNLRDTNRFSPSFSLVLAP